MPTDRDWDDYYDKHDRAFDVRLKRYYEEQKQHFEKMSMEEQIEFLIEDYVIRHSPTR